MENPKDLPTLLRETYSDRELTFGTTDEDKSWTATELTGSETEDALNAARREKYYREKQRNEFRMERERVEALNAPWPAEIMLEYVRFRAMRFGFSRNYAEGDVLGKDGRRVFRLDAANSAIYHILSLYFTNDPAFEQLQLPGADCKAAGWKLNRGLLVCGAIGCGKTKMMQLFAVNKKQNYEVLSATEMANQYTTKGEYAGAKIIEQFTGQHRPIQVLHEGNLWQGSLGLCIDDIGTEEDKVFFGNKSNVVAEILAARYGNGNLPWHMTHATTNLNLRGLTERYGERLVSRMKEMWNVIQLPGEDRRHA